MTTRFKFYLSNPKMILCRLVLLLDKHFVMFPAKFYLSCYYYFHVGEKLNWDEPKKFNEKLQWLKLYNHDPLYTTLVDKYAVKGYVEKQIGAEYVIPTIATYERVEDIDWDSLPNQFVIKCNHDSFSYVICKDKSQLDRKAAEKRLGHALKVNYYRIAREWPYKNVKRKIIVEKYIEDPSGDLKDYKFFCFNGKVKAMFIATDRQKGPAAARFDFFDENYNHLPMVSEHPNAEVTPVKPENFELMKSLAEKMSQGIPFVRVDFYDTQGKVLFGEFTMFHHGGTATFDPEEFEYKFGSWINLPAKRNS